VWRRFKIREYERGLLFKDRVFRGVLSPGRHFVWDPLFEVRVDVVSAREEWLTHGDLDVNKVTEAKKAVEAALITRREETEAKRSQANTAKILESNPTLMRLRELEVLENVTQKADLTVMLAEKGLADRVVKLL
jgi:hypothetical protein